MKGNWVEFSIFLQKAKEAHLPTSRMFWRTEEKAGRITFTKLPSGRRIFKSEAEVDELLSKYLKVNIRA